MESKSKILPKEVKQSVEYRMDDVLKYCAEDQKTDMLDSLFEELYPFLDELAIRALTETLIESCPNGLQSEY